MKTTLILGSIASLALAQAPWDTPSDAGCKAAKGNGPNWGGNGSCLLTDKTAQQIADNFAEVFSNFSEELANNTYAIDLTDQTDSVGWLISNGTNCPHPVCSQTLGSRREFLDAQETQPNLPFVIENVWHDCVNVITRWKFDIKPQQAQGIAVLHVTENPNASEQFPFLIDHIYSEFNTGAFLVDLGEWTGVPPPGCPASSAVTGTGISKREAAPGPMLQAWTSFGRRMGLH